MKTELNNSDLIVFEYGAMSSRYSLLASNKLTAYCAMCYHFDSSNHLIAIYEPKEIIKNDSWLNLTGKVADRLDEIFGGQGTFDKYYEEHEQEILKCVETIQQII